MGTCAFSGAAIAGSFDAKHDFVGAELAPPQTPRRKHEGSSPSADRESQNLKGLSKGIYRRKEILNSYARANVVARAARKSSAAFCFGSP